MVTPDSEVRPRLRRPSAPLLSTHPRHWLLLRGPRDCPNAL